MAGRFHLGVSWQLPRDVAVEGGVRGARGPDDRQEVPMTARTARVPHIPRRCGGWWVGWAGPFARLAFYFQVLVVGLALAERRASTGGTSTERRGGCRDKPGSVRRNQLLLQLLYPFGASYASAPHCPPASSIFRSFPELRRCDLCEQAGMFVAFFL